MKIWLILSLFCLHYLTKSDGRTNFRYRHFPMYDPGQIHLSTKEPVKKPIQINTLQSQKIPLPRNHYTTPKPKPTFLSKGAALLSGFWDDLVERVKKISKTASDIVKNTVETVKSAVKTVTNIFQGNVGSSPGGILSVFGGINPFGTLFGGSDFKEYSDEEILRLAEDYGIDVNKGDFLEQDTNPLHSENLLRNINKTILDKEPNVNSTIMNIKVPSHRKDEQIDLDISTPDTTSLKPSRMLRSEECITMEEVAALDISSLARSANWEIPICNE